MAPLLNIFYEKSMDFYLCFGAFLKLWAYWSHCISILDIKPFPTVNSGCVWIRIYGSRSHIKSGIIDNLQTIHFHRALEP